MLKSWGIRDRMLLLALVPPALIAMIVGFYLINTRIDDLHQAHRERGLALARQLAPTAEYGLRTGDMAVVEHLVAATLRDSAVTSVRLLDGDGKTLMQARQAHGAEPDDPNWLTRMLEFSVAASSVFSAPVALPSAQGQAQGRIEVVLSRRQTRARQLEVLFNGVLIIAIGLLVSFVLAINTSRDIIVPILRLTRAVRSFRRGELTRRVPEISGGELGTLERGINAMAKSLQASRQDLQGQIYRSNAELRQTLEELEIKNVELDLARRRAEEASKVKSRFLANMSHEIRTPVNGIIGFIRLLAQGRLEREQAEYVQIIHKSADNLLSIINDILDFSRIEAGKLVIDHQPFDLVALVDETVGLMAPLAYDKQLELIHLVYEDVPRRVKGDPVRLRQILTNLLSNAIKFTPRGEIAVRVMLEAETADEVSIKVTVSDTGIGIAADQQARIFEAFNQADSLATRQYGGTGLGLFITERLLQAMNGRIGFSSTPGKGAKFFFILPLEKISGAHKPPPPVEVLVGRRALIYEPYHLASLAIRHLLDGWGLSVHECETLEELREEIAGTETPADFVVLGIDAASARSADTLTLIGEMSRQGPTLVTLVNSVDRQVMESLREAGAGICLPKVINRGKLLEMMAGAVGEVTDSESKLVSLPHHPLSLPGTAAQLADLRLLVADDNRINLRLLVTLLRRNGARVDTANNGREAVERFFGNRYDAVLLDVHMPVMSGIDAMRQMRREEPAGRHTPILAVTANAIPDEWRRFREAGMDDCLVKPIDEDELVRVLHRWCTGSPVTDRPMPSASPGQRDSVPPSAEPTATARALDKATLEMLLEDLPVQQDTMNAAYSEERLGPMREQVHLIHGSAAFCKLHPIERAAASLERHLQQNPDDNQEIGYLVARLNREIDAFLKHYRPTPRAGS